MMSVKRLVGLLVLCLLCGGVAKIPPASACAGYTLTVGSDGSPQQELLTQILAELIRQRTGTTIELVRFASPAELLAAASRHDIDLLVADIDQRPLPQGLQPLQPFGCQDARIVPVFHVETLKRFPALSRLINRLAGNIDDGVLQRLEFALMDGGHSLSVAKKFLAEQNLIFGG